MPHIKNGIPPFLGGEGMVLLASSSEPPGRKLIFTDARNMHPEADAAWWLTSGSRGERLRDMDFFLGMLRCLQVLS